MGSTPPRLHIGSQLALLEWIMASEPHHGVSENGAFRQSKTHPPVESEKLVPGNCAENLGHVGSAVAIEELTTGVASG
jgi:hypothetical protein